MERATFIDASRGRTNTGVARRQRRRADAHADRHDRARGASAPLRAALPSRPAARPAADAAREPTHVLERVCETRAPLRRNNGWLTTIRLPRHAKQSPGDRSLRGAVRVDDGRARTLERSRSVVSGSLMVHREPPCTGAPL